MSSILPTEVYDQEETQVSPMKNPRFSTTPVNYDPSSFSTVRIDPRDIIINNQVICENSQYSNNGHRSNRLLFVQVFCTSFNGNKPKHVAQMAERVATNTEVPSSSPRLGSNERVSIKMNIASFCDIK